MNQVSLEVRFATDADGPAIRGLVFPIMEGFGLGPDPEGADRDLTDVEASYFAVGGWLELVYADNKLVGTVGMLPVGEQVIELRKMYLHADMRGRGLGKVLLARSIDKARQAGYREIVLETATVLEAAIGLYRGFGFTRATDQYPGCGKRACDQVWRLQLDNFQPPETHLALIQR